MLDEIHSVNSVYAFIKMVFFNFPIFFLFRDFLINQIQRLVNVRVRVLDIKCYVCGDEYVDVNVSAVISVDVDGRHLA